MTARWVVACLASLILVGCPSHTGLPPGPPPEYEPTPLAPWDGGVPGPAPVGPPAPPGADGGVTGSGRR
jgi:hypothetical protein